MQINYDDVTRLAASREEVLAWQERVASGKAAGSSTGDAPAGEVPSGSAGRRASMLVSP